MSGCDMAGSEVVVLERKVLDQKGRPSGCCSWKVYVVDSLTQQPSASFLSALCSHIQHILGLLVHDVAVAFRSRETFLYLVVHHVHCLAEHLLATA